MNDYRTELATIVADATPGSNSDALGSDFQLKRAGNLVRVTVQTTGASAINLVPNSGSAVTLGTTSAGVASTYELALDQGRTWNVQTVAETAIELLVVQEVQA